MVVFALSLLGVHTVLVLANIYVPLCHFPSGVEVFLAKASVAASFGFPLAFMVFGVNRQLPREKLAPVVMIAFFTCGPTFWSSLERKSREERVHWTFEGVVADKYISDNHGAFGLVIEKRNYEPIPQELWSHAVVGSSLSKNECEDFVAMNGVRYPLTSN